MYNAYKPNANELPSTAKLIKSTIVAAVCAGAILVTVILPAEYAIDPTGVGRIIGLTEMGEIKTQLALEAQKEDQKEAKASKPKATQSLLPKANAKTQDNQTEVSPQWRERARLILSPGQGAEIKLVMNKGAI
ncbi:MAG: transmembrane anchor protein, partial [Cohaesibacter sp.]|nr:transmembrane anchor protein [Cohaesibacter sp.]